MLGLTDDPDPDPDAVAAAPEGRWRQLVGVAPDPPVVPEGEVLRRGFTLEPPLAAANSQLKTPSLLCWRIDADVESSFLGPPEDW